MAGLAEFLLARIAEDETAAQEARGWKAPPEGQRRWRPSVGCGADQVISRKGTASLTIAPMPEGDV
jgi:hypothetical protein